jgi:UDP-glucose 4-epimerase
LDTRSAVYNLGCGGAGYSVMEVIEIAREITGREIPIKLGPRRLGDPAVLIASSDEIKKDLGWSPRFGDLRLIIESAWTLIQINKMDRALPVAGANA